MADKATIPVKILREAEEHTISVESKSGESFRGTLQSVEESMNCLLQGVTKTKKSGETQTLEQIYLRGNQVNLYFWFLVLQVV